MELGNDFQVKYKDVRDVAAIAVSEQEVIATHGETAMKTARRVTVLSLVSIFGFAAGVPGAQQRRSQVSQLEDCLAECQASLGQEGAEILGECKGGCWHAEAVRLRSADKCDVILQEASYGGMAGYRNCVTDVAVVVRDYKICRRIANQAGRGYCLARLATETGNVAICMEIRQAQTPGDMNDECFYYGVALPWKRPEVCNYIRSKDVRDECRRIVGGAAGN